jgi:hypothetical protein
LLQGVLMAGRCRHDAHGVVLTSAPETTKAAPRQDILSTERHRVSGRDSFPGEGSLHREQVPGADLHDEVGRMKPDPHSA